MLVTFRTAYINSDTNVVERRSNKIACHYMKSPMFYSDLLSSLPFDLIILMLNTDNRALRLLKILKLTRLFRIRRIAALLKDKLLLKASIKIIYLLVFVIILTHFTNCTWYYTVIQDEQWIPNKDLDWPTTVMYSGSKRDQYILIYYYMTLKMFGVDIFPNTILEVSMAILLV